MKEETVNYQVEYLPNIPILFCDVPNSAMEQLQNEVREIQTNFNLAKPYNWELAGHINQEYELTKSKPILNDFVCNYLSKIYDNESDFLRKFDIANKNFPLILDNLWVNFQKKGEYNPTHTHSGILSFVIYLQVPFYAEDELKTYDKMPERMRSSGVFEFVYSNIIGNIGVTKYRIDKNWEGKMLLFPSSLNHTVYPFQTSDDYRISISGNIKLNGNV